MDLGQTSYHTLTHMIMSADCTSTGSPICAAWGIITAKQYWHTRYASSGRYRLWSATAFLRPNIPAAEHRGRDKSSSEERSERSDVRATPRSPTGATATGATAVLHSATLLHAPVVSRVAAASAGNELTGRVRTDKGAAEPGGSKQVLPREPSGSPFAAGAHGVAVSPFGAGALSLARHGESAARPARPPL